MDGSHASAVSPFRALISGAILFVVLGGIALARTVCSPDARDAEPLQVEITGETMATTYSVKVVVDAGEIVDPRELAAVVTEQLDLVEGTMSRFDPDSDLSRLNRWEGPEPYAATEELARMLALALDVGARSDGAFDVTVGPLMTLWGFDARTGRATLPTADEIAAARARCGLDKLSVDTANATVRKSRPDVDVDLSGIAKGLAVDQVSDALSARGLARHLVEVGGEVRARGTNRAGVDWRVGVEDPRAGVREIGQVVALSEMAMATSGDYRNFYEIGDRRISHTMDPHTGLPVEHPVAAVTVLHPRCAEADAWATALMVLGLEQGLAVARREDLAALLVTRTADGTIARHATEAFTAAVATMNAEPSGVDDAPGAPAAGPRGAGADGERP